MYEKPIDNITCLVDELNDIESVLKYWGGVEVSAMDVYSDMFKLGEGLIQQSGEASGEFKANPLIYFKNEGDEYGQYRILFEDTFEESINEAQKADFTLINGLTYFGKRNTQQNASKMFAMIFDLDDVDVVTVTALLSGSIVADAYPCPNYVILSGSGLHLYYLFDEPIALFPYIKQQLKEFKYAMTDRLWNENTSNAIKVQHQGINQGFKVIGGKTKVDSPEVIVRAFRMNTHPYTLRELCEYVPKEFRIDEKKLFKESKYTLEQAKQRFPKWYEKVIVNGDKTPIKWDIAGKVKGNNPYALYDWWLRQIKSGATVGHRYFSIMALVIYAIKNDVPYERLVNDAYDLVPYLNALNPSKPFIKEDVDSALDCYDDRFATYPRKELERLSAIDIPANKRNFLKQAWHLEDCRAKKVRMKERGIAFKNPEGRPQGSSKQRVMIKAWRKFNPEGRKVDCVRELGISRSTVNRWWNSEE